MTIITDFSLIIKFLTIKHNMYFFFKKNDLRDDRFVTPQSFHNFAYKWANLWNTFLEQSSAHSKKDSLVSIKSQSKHSIMKVKHQHNTIN